MWKLVCLVLPVLVPSWRFFQSIQPSPRVQWALISNGEAEVADWREFRPRPVDVSASEMLMRLFWNPRWNEALFLASCAERLQTSPTAHSIDEIQQRVRHGIGQMHIDVMGKRGQFRLVFVQRAGAGLSEDVVYLSDTFAIDDHPAR